jgi:hypothetical protein
VQSPNPLLQNRRQVRETHAAAALAPVGQMLPQPPQLVGSYVVLTHAPPHGVVPPPQLAMHMFVIVLQIVPAPQVVMPGSQLSSDSLQLSMPLHEIASAHMRPGPPTHAPAAEHVSMVVQ